MTPRPCGPRKRAVMIVLTSAPIIQYAFVPLVSVTAFQSFISAIISGEPVPVKETIVVRVLRAAFRAWPFMHGRGWILRVARVFLGGKTVLFDLRRGVFVEGQ